MVDCHVNALSDWDYIVHFLYPIKGPEFWTIKTKTKSRIVATEMKLTRTSLGYNSRSLLWASVKFMKKSRPT